MCNIQQQLIVLFHRMKQTFGRFDKPSMYIAPRFPPHFFALFNFFLLFHFYPINKIKVFKIHRENNIIRIALLYFTVFIKVTCDSNTFELTCRYMACRVVAHKEAAKGRTSNSYPAWKTGPLLRVAEVPQPGLR